MISLERSGIVRVDVRRLQQHRNDGGYPVGRRYGFLLHQLQRCRGIERGQQDALAASKEVGAEQEARNVEQRQVLQQHLVRSDLHFHGVANDACGKCHPVDRGALGAPRGATGIENECIQIAVRGIRVGVRYG